MLRSTHWSEQTYTDIDGIISTAKPDVAHVHNTLPLISPSIYYACAQRAVPIVQTLHNFRLLCPAATFLKDGKICEKCQERSLIDSVFYRCYRDSFIQSAVVANMLHHHRKRQTFNRLIDAFIALTEFHRAKFIAGGLPAAKIFTRANFTRPVQVQRNGSGKFALFIGRLSPEKGLGTLINAWKNMPDIPLKIAGGGPLIEAMASKLIIEKINHVELLGFVNSKKRTELLAEARFLVVPSNWYEGMPTVVLEAFAAGIPVLASRIGSLAELIDDGKTGRLFEPMHELDLCEKARSLFHDEKALQTMSTEAKIVFEKLYSPEVGYKSLMEIYDKVRQSGT